MNFEYLRKKMVEEQIVHRGIHNSQVIEAMRKVWRHEFIPEQELSNAYADCPLSIGNGQTISQPSTVARMLQLSHVRTGNDSLEIGSGSGWNACLLAYLAFPGKTLSLERISALTKFAQENSARALDGLPKKFKERLSSLSYETQNIFKDPKKIEGIYSCIIITAGIEKGQEGLIRSLARERLRSGGRLVCPYQRGPLIIMDKQGGNITVSHTREQYVFVPLLD